MVAGTAVVLCFASQVVAVHNAYQGNWTGLFYHGSAFPSPPALRASTWVHPGHGYDGQFYRFAAHDPLLRHGYAGRMDDAALRYRRILLPALASLASPFGIGAVDAAYLALLLAAIGAGVWFTAALVAVSGQSTWWGLLFLALPATIASVDRALLDGPLCAAVAAFLYFHRRGWIGAMVATCAAAALLRETGLLLAGAGMLGAMMERRPKRAAAFAASTVALLAWAAYVASVAPSGTYGNIMSRPVWGLFARLLEFRSVPEWPPLVTAAIQALDVASMLGLIAAIGISIRLGVRDWPAAPAILGLLFGALAMTLAAPSHLLDPFGYLRPVSPLLLLVSLEAVRRGTRWMLLPLAATGLATVPGPAVTLLRAVGLLTS